MRRVSWAPGRPSSCRARPAHLIGPSAGPLPRLATRASCAVVCARAGVAVVCARCTPRRRCRVRSLHAPASLLCALAARAGVAVVWARCTRRRQRKSGARGGCGPAVSIQTEAPGALAAPVVSVTRWPSARSCDLPRPQACPGSGVTVRVMTRSSRPGAMWHGLDTGTARQAGGHHDGPTLVTQARILIPQCS